MSAAVQFDINGSFRVQELEVKFKPHRKLPLVQLSSPQAVHEFLKPIMADEPRERLVVLSLSPTNGVLGMETVSVGTSNASLVSPREVFKAPLITNASSIIVAHNHPSGSVEPSKKDLFVLETLRQACALLDIELIDFLIIAPRSYYSAIEKDPALVKGIQMKEVKNV